MRATPITLVFVAAAVAFTSSSSIAACSLLVDTGDLNNPPASTTSSKDAETDVTTPTPDDGSSTDDAHTPSQQDGDAAKGPFCASNPGHTACFDFDDGSSILPAPLTKVVTGAATVAVDSSHSQSVPSALHCNVPTMSGGQGGVRYDFASTPTSITVSFSMYITQTAIDLATLTNVNFKVDNGTFWQTGLKASSGGSTFELVEYGEENNSIRISVSYPLAPQIINTWIRVRMSIQLGANPTAEIDIDGTKLTKPITPPTWLATAPQRRAVFGVSFLDNRPPVDLFIDDILLDVSSQ